MAQRNSCLLFASICSIICGGVIIGLAVWNANQVAWSPLTNAIAGVGGVLMAVSLMGIINSQGCTFCCNIALYLYVTVMALLTAAGVAFIIVAAVKKSVWIENMARRYASDDSEENIDHLKKEYDEFMPYVIAFGVITVVSCLIGFLSGIKYLRSLSFEQRHRREVLLNERVDRRTHVEREKVKQKHHDTIVQMTEKYGRKKDPQGRLLP